MASLADLWVTVRADTSAVPRDIRKGLGGINLDPEGRRAGNVFSRAVAAGAKPDETGRQLGTKVGGGFHGTFTRLIGSAAAGMGAAFATVKIGGFLKDAITQASDMNETVNKSGIIFGKNAGVISSWASNASTKLGLSKQAALESAASFGDMFQQIGFSGGAATKMSQKVVQLSADLGSFNNLPTAQVQDMIAASFRGEYDSLQRVIPNINAARVQQVAMNETGKTSASTLTAQEKAHATLSIIQKDGARAQGDFARTSGGLANQQKILSAQTSDLKARLGQQLLPAQLAVTSAGNGLLSGFLGQQKAAGGLTGKANQLGLGVRALAQSFQSGQSSSTGFVGVMERLGVRAGALATQVRSISLAGLVKSFRDGTVTGQGLEGRLQGLAARAGELWRQLQTVDFAKLRAGLAGANDQLPTVVSGFKVAGTGLGFLASHTDLLAKALPVLVAGLVAVKIAQAAGNVAAAAAIPLRVAEVLVNRRLAASNTQLIAAITTQTAVTKGTVAAETASTAAKNGGVLASVRQRVATVAAAVAQKAAAAATLIWAGAQKVLNLALRANPIGIVVTALAALGAGLVLAYKKSDTFRRLVDGAFSGLRSVAVGAIDGVLAGLQGFARGMAFIPGLGDKFRGVADSIGGLRQAVQSVVPPTQIAAEAVRSYSRAEVIASENRRDAATAARGLATSQANNAEETRKLNEKTRTLIDSFTILRTGSLDAGRAADAVKRAEIDLAAAVKGHSKQLAGNSGAALTNRERLRGVADALETEAQSLVKSRTKGKDLNDTARITNDVMKEQRAKFIAAAQKAGFHKDEIDKLAKSLFAVPKKTPAQVSTPGAEAAIRSIGRVREEIAKVKGKTVHLSVGATWASASDAARREFHGSAEGSITGTRFRPRMHRFGNGGFENHVAQIARPGVTPRVWAEKETGGELYAPLAKSKRGRSKQIMERGAQIMGGQIQWFAEGGIREGLTRRLQVLTAASNANRVADQIGPGITKAMLAALKVMQAALNKYAGGGPINPGYNGALRWARTQVGKPYGWGGVGPRSYDCSGFQSAILNIIKGRRPYSRLFSTGSLGSRGGAGMIPGRSGAFRIGTFTGNPGHMAGTLNGVNVESSGGAGVRVGGRARGANHPMFNHHFYLKSGIVGQATSGRTGATGTSTSGSNIPIAAADGGILKGEPAWDVLDKRGHAYVPGLGDLLKRGTFDKGGVARGKGWIPKATVLPERVLSPRQNATYEKSLPALERLVAAMERQPHEADDRFLRLANRPIEITVMLDGKVIGRAQGRRADMLVRGG